VSQIAEPLEAKTVVADMDGGFEAIDAHTGTERWMVGTGMRIVGNPSGRRGPDQKEHVAGAVPDGFAR
jgi:hypothetical protein